ncbi:hydroxymethylbilane synthase [Amaricoccus solimangrovi]|uniref:Porphobilinogen deaminase n=1 Tax=Amaricoccus solimangrovi TaxID=2589815 RepID=A0A501WMK5_9RHOB|nr:hydroxymethylbilane synthase [Amaricoccus solimangrovi]TPE49424.1 hydroxymethylbilane synthase [Amaricoccus solimangrovi]
MTDLPDPDRPLRIGTRGSPLALAQAQETKIRLMAAHGLPEAAFVIVPIKTTGDRVQDRSLSELGGKGLFTREIEDALLAGEIDIAVHSMKDMPTLQPGGLAITCYLPREDVRDAFVSLDARALGDLPPGAVVGTSSLRRRAQLRHRRPDLEVVEFRGNVQTRLRKLSEGVAEATFLAMAGLRRLGLPEIAKAPIPVDEMLPAVAQGAIGVEQRLDDAAVGALLARINDADTCHRLRAERALLAGLDGSCQTPIAGLATLSEGKLRLRAEILRPDGSECVAGETSGGIAEAEDLGAALAAELLGRAGPGFLAS